MTPRSYRLLSLSLIALKTMRLLFSTFSFFLKRNIYRLKQKKVINNYIKLFRSVTDRHNVILRSLLLLVTGIKIVANHNI